MNVLVVDDDYGMCKTLCDILRVKGYDCQATYSGEEAIERVRQKDYGCVLMDIKMPGINGVEAFQTIRKITINTAIILMTAYYTDPLVLKAKQKGVLALLPKPLDLTSLLNFLSFLKKGKATLIKEDFSEMKAEEYNVLYLEVNKLRALGDALRWNASKLQNDTMETIAGLIFDISNHILEKLREMQGGKGAATGGN